MRYHIKKTARALTLAALTTITATAHAGLQVDRGLPGANLNNAAGSDRSNVAWGFSGDYLAGDDFTLGNINTSWAIDSLRLWVIGSEETLGDRFDNLSLFLGGGSEISKVSTANLTGNTSDNTNVSISEVTYPGSTETYQGSGGGLLNIWQLDFSNLGTFTGGTLLFAVAGGTDPQLQQDTQTPITFTHASNAALSGTPQQGSDGQYLWFAGNAQSSSIAFGGSIDSNGNGWDKSSDINVQVVARQVPVPATALLMALGLACGAALRHRRRPA